MECNRMLASHRLALSSSFPLVASRLLSSRLAPSRALRRIRTDFSSLCPRALFLLQEICARSRGRLQQRSFAAILRGRTAPPAPAFISAFAFISICRRIWDQSAGARRKKISTSRTNQLEAALCLFPFISVQVCLPFIFHASWQL